MQKKERKKERGRGRIRTQDLSVSSRLLYLSATAPNHQANKANFIQAILIKQNIKFCPIKVFKV